MDYSKNTTELNDVLNAVEKKVKNEISFRQIKIRDILLGFLEDTKCLANYSLRKVTRTAVITQLKGLCKNDTLKSIAVVVKTDDYSENAMDVFNVLSERVKGRLINSVDVLAEILNKDGEIFNVVKASGVTIEMIISSIAPQNGIPKKAAKKREEVKKEQKQKTEQEPKMFHPTNVSALLSNMRGDFKEKDESLTNLSSKSASGELRPVIGNDDVITAIFSGLAKKNNGNVILIGGSGVGKTATARHLANLLESCETPLHFNGYEMYELNLSDVLSCSGIRGSLEAKMWSIEENLKKRGRTILLIDNIHTYMDSGGKIGEVNFENVIGGLLDNERINVVFTASDADFVKNISNNTAFMRKVTKVELKEKSVTETVDVVKMMKDEYESYHRVLLDDDIIEYVAKSAKRFLADKKLPESAMDLVDYSCALKKINADFNRVYKEEYQKMTDVRNSVKTKPTDHSYESAKKAEEAELKVSELSKRLDNLRKTVLTGKITDKLTERDVLRAVSFLSKTPLTELEKSEKEMLRNMEVKLKSVIVGQDEALSNICKAIRRRRVGITNLDKPIVIFLSGTTGTGKTYTAKQVTKEVFGNEKDMIRFNMSEYSDSSSVTKLYGSSTGYIGYENGGILTEMVKKKPYSLLLFDEVEKAHDKVFDVFLQIFDDGVLTDNKGVEVDFKNTIIIMTSNIGTKELIDNENTVGFVKDNSSKSKFSIMMKAMKDRFRPEFINRIDSIVLFNTLGDDEIRNIVRLELEKLKKRVEEAKYTINGDLLSENIVDYIMENTKYERSYGARPIMREIQNTLEDEITEMIINDVDNSNIINVSDFLFLKNEKN